MRPLAGAVAVLLAAGCTPILMDGAYSCEDGVCPPGWMCRSDERCYAMRARLGVPCQDDGECDSGACSAAVPGSSAGYCTLECTADADCNDLGGGARCVLSRCLEGCSDRSECPSGNECQMPHQPRTMPPSGGSCAAIDDPAFTGATGCAVFEECQPPGFCIASDDPSVGTVGVCSMWCNDDSNCAGGRCVALLEEPSGNPVRHCLLECFPGTECASPLRCGRLLGEGAPPGSVCIPEAWDGRTLPLPGDLAMPARM